jgi:hypothetical protein
VNDRNGLAGFVRAPEVAAGVARTTLVAHQAETVPRGERVEDPSGARVGSAQGGGGSLSTVTRRCHSRAQVRTPVSLHCHSVLSLCTIILQNKSRILTLTNLIRDFLFCRDLFFKKQTKIPDQGSLYKREWGEEAPQHGPLAWSDHGPSGLATLCDRMLYFVSLSTCQRQGRSHYRTRVPWSTAHTSQRFPKAAGLTSLTAVNFKLKVNG